MVLKVYADESGKGDPRTFVMAGQIARAEQWAVFEEDWRVALAKPPAIDYFHMNEAVAARDFQRIADMGAVIRKHGFSVIAVSFYMPDYNAIIRGRISRRFDSPYFLGLTSLIDLAIQWQIDHNVCELMDFIFDEQFRESDHLQAIWGDTYAAMSPEIKERFGQRPIHLDDKKTIPLQAADMFAWTWRRILDDSKSYLETDQFLNGIFEGVPFTRDDWVAEKMISFLTYHKRRNAQLGRMTEHEFSRASQNRDVIYDAFNRHSLKKAKAGETVPLVSIQAKGIGRFLLVDRCPRSDSPHLHRRSGGECLVAPLR